jgi:hypothetical protein
MFDERHLLQLCQRLAQEPEPGKREVIVREIITILQAEQQEITKQIRNAIGDQ